MITKHKEIKYGKNYHTKIIAIPDAKYKNKEDFIDQWIYDYNYLIIWLGRGYSIKGLRGVEIIKAIAL